MTEHRLIQAGVLLFLLGLINGLVIPLMASPRLALSGHLEGVMNGMLLILIGVIWPRIKLSQGASKLTIGLLLYGTYVNWFTVLLASFWGAGSKLMPIAGGKATGTPVQEGIIKFGLTSLALAMIVALFMILWGLRKEPQQTS